ncbi:DUF6879 family protein [Streptomyces sp. NPDC005574]|uniref:DUF6879 family protein n=1 Tax=Streptomyces sp. NPDC005574 TaxID=3156891 RepID=UPI0033B94422
MPSAERNRLFESIQRDAFHLELRDDYSVPDEGGPFKSWLDGDDVDYSYLTPWTQLMKGTTQRGVTVRRVRVVTEPLTSYIRWEYSTTRLNEEAGENIRWLPRHLLAEGITFPFDGRDWWLFDEHLLAIGYFAPDGRVLGSRLIDDPDTVTQCVRLRDLLWTCAIPHAQYKPENIREHTSR